MLSALRRDRRDFQASVELLRYARYENCYIFKYSPRPGTTADARLADDVPDEVKRRRNNDLLAVQAEISLAHHRTMLEQTIEVLVEGFSKRALKAQESEQSRGDEIGFARPPMGNSSAGRAETRSWCSTARNSPASVRVRITTWRRAHCRGGRADDGSREIRNRTALRV
jgi:hypothetical protein